MEINRFLLGKAVVYSVFICLGLNVFFELFSHVRGPWQTVLYAMKYDFQNEVIAEVEEIEKYNSPGKGSSISYVVNYKWQNGDLECRSNYVSASLRKVPYNIVRELYIGGPIKAYVTRRGCHGLLIKSDADFVFKRHVIIWVLIFLVLIPISYRIVLYNQRGY